MINIVKPKETLMYSTISLSHIDLDGISCQLILDHRNKNIKFYNCNYDKINVYLEYIDDNCSEYRPDNVFITDLSFDKTQVIKLARIVHNHPNVKFTYIDHHPYDEDLMNIFLKIKSLPNFKFIHSIKASTTKLTYKYLDSLKSFNNKELEKYVEYVNAYDLWLQDTEYFKVGFVFNELFFSYKLKPFFFEMRDSFKLKDKHKEKYKKLVQEKSVYYDKIEKNNLIFKDSNKLYIFIDEFKSWVEKVYPNYDYYIIASTYARISIRISNNISDEKAEEVKKYIIENKDMTGVISIGGHDKAFGITLEPETSIDRLIMQVQDISKLLEKIT